MEDNRNTREQSLRRCYECNRLEEQLWNAAYEQIWPVIRRSWQRPTAQNQPRRSGGAAPVPMARRA